MKRGVVIWIIVGIIHANKDSSYCELVQDDSAKHVCYFMLAVSSENINFCDDIDYLDNEGNKNEKSECYYSFISNLYQWGKSDEITTEYCNKFPSDWDQSRTACFAMKERDVSMCGNDSECLTHFEQPLSFCDESPKFVSCIKDRAKTSKNVSICEMLSQPDRDSCIGVYCTHTELDANICDMIEDVEIRQDYYIELAMNLGNL